MGVSRWFFCCNIPFCKDGFFLTRQIYILSRVTSQAGKDVWKTRTEDLRTKTLFHLQSSFPNIHSQNNLETEDRWPKTDLRSSINDVWSSIFGFRFLKTQKSVLRTTCILDKISGWHISIYGVFFVSRFSYSDSVWCNFHCLWRQSPANKKRLFLVLLMTMQTYKNKCKTLCQYIIQYILQSLLMLVWP